MTKVAVLFFCLWLFLPVRSQTTTPPDSIKIGAFDANRNAQVPVYMLRIEKGGKFTLQQ